MRKKIRALQIVGDSRFGGASLVVADLGQLLQDHDISTTVLATDPAMMELVKRQGLRVWPFAGIQREVHPVDDARILASLTSKLRGRFELVHTHTTKGGALGRIAARLAGVPAIIHTVHGFAFHEFSGKLATVAGSLVEKLLTYCCHEVVFVNEHDRLMAQQRGIVPANKAHTVYNGMSPERLVPGLKANRKCLLQRIGLEDPVFLCVLVGRLAQQKGLEYLLSAINIVAKSHPALNIHLAVIGEGELAGQCRYWAESFKISDCVHFLGFQPNGVCWTSIADCFVLSSLWEGHSITLLEAMALGKPIVATDIKGNRETIVNNVNGLLVQPANAKALAQAITTIAADSLLSRRLGEEAQRSHGARFSLSMFRSNMWKIYEDLLLKQGLL